jgi:hypothetical protein
MMLNVTLQILTDTLFINISFLAATLVLLNDRQKAGAQIKPKENNYVEQPALKF